MQKVERDGEAEGLDMLFPINGEAIPDETIARCKDFRMAVRLCIEVSGLEKKEVAHELGMKENFLSRILNPSEDDNRYFPDDKLELLMDICENEIPLRWLALRRGYGLVKLKTALEVENERLKRELQEKAKEMECIKSFLKDVREVG